MPTKHMHIRMRFIIPWFDFNYYEFEKLIFIQNSTKTETKNTSNGLIGIGPSSGASLRNEEIPLIMNDQES